MLVFKTKSHRLLNQSSRNSLRHVCSTANCCLSKWYIFIGRCIRYNGVCDMFYLADNPWEVSWGLNRQPLLPVEAYDLIVIIFFFYYLQLTVFAPEFTAVFCVKLI